MHLSVPLPRCCRFPLGHNSLSFLDGDALVGRDVREPLFGPARPLDLERGDGAARAQAKRQREVALRAVARTAADPVPLLAGSALDAHDRADAVAVRLRTDGADGEPVVLIAAVIAE